MRTSRALFLVAILLLTPLSYLSQNSLAADSTIQVNTTWSGNVVLTGNVTVSNGSTLTLSQGTTVDGGDGYWIRVDGTLLANSVQFFSSQTPLTAGSHGAGMWTGIYVASKGHALLDQVTISNAKTALKVDGNLSASKLVIEDAYIGINNFGTSTINTLTAEHIDYEVVRNSGSLHLSKGTFEDVAGGIWSTGTTTIDTVTVSQAGTGLRSTSGTLQASGIDFSNTSVAIASQNGASTNIQHCTGDNISLFIDAANSDDLTVSNAFISGKRLLLANGASSLTMTDIEFVGVQTEFLPVVDQRCDGTCNWANIDVSNVNFGLSLSGNGNHSLSSVNLTSYERGIEGTGVGNIAMDWANISAGTTGIGLRDPDSNFANTHIVTTSSDSTAIDLLGGKHTWTSVATSKAYSAFDTTSVALAAWYSDISTDTFSSLHFGNGIVANHASLTAQEVSVKDGKGTGILLDDSTMAADTLRTRAYPNAVILNGESHLQLSNFAAENHATPLEITTHSSATIRNFQPLNTPSSSSDALGDGTLIYGGSTSAIVSVSQVQFLDETPVTFTDLAGNPVQASITVHGYHLMSDINGAATLPLIASGSTVDITLSGAGIRVTLFGSQMGQSVQVPVIPQGDWTIDSGQFVYLGERPDGTPHVLTGNLTILTGGGLEVSNTILQLPTLGTVTLEGTATLAGSDATIKSHSLSVGIDSTVSQSSGSGDLTIESNVTWVCQSVRSSNNLVIDGSLLIQPNCQVELLDGQISGAITVLTGGELTMLSSLEISVLDKGQPVVGATISIDGAVTMTDANGKVATNAVARQVDDSSDTLGSVKNINLQIGSFYDFITWDTLSSFEYTFMASTITPGTLSNWMVLESRWSPYFLDADLTVESSGTLTIDDGVSLRISDGSKITVDGRIDVGAATLSSTGLGSRWGGLLLTGADALVDLSNTNFVEASPALNVQGQGTFVADGVTIARASGSDPLIQIDSNSNATIVLKNSQLYDAGDGCIKAFPSSTQLSLESVEMESCNGIGIWARQVEVNMNDITLGENISTGFDLTSVIGSLSQVNATQFNGQGHILSLESIDADFSVTSFNGTVGAAAGISVTNSRNIQMNTIQLTGSPGIDVDNSAGVIEDVILNGQGSGTAFICHHGRSSDSLYLIDVVAFSYSVGIDLHDDGDGTAIAPIIVRNPDIITSTVLSSENYPARIEGGSFYGIVSASGLITIDLIDATSDNSAMYNGAELRTWETFTFSATLDGTLHSVEFTASTSGLASEFSFSASGNSVLIEIPTSIVKNQSSSSLTQFTLETHASGLPNTIQNISYSSTMSKNVILVLTANSPPSVEITSPYSGERVMESYPLLAILNYSDDHDLLQDLSLVWIVTDASGVEVMRGPSEPQYNITDLQFGLYVLEVYVTDTLGATSSDAVDFEITELDSDGDWTSTCIFTQSTGVWFDQENGYSCGPDSEDSDDDNDGHIDIRDAWPVDPCAWLDSDGDGFPNSVDCPEGKETYLIADLDDDGNGVLDSQETETSSESGDFSTGTLLLIVLIIGGIVLFMMRTKRGGEKNWDDSTSIDERHL